MLASNIAILLPRIGLNYIQSKVEISTIAPLVPGTKIPWYDFDGYVALYYGYKAELITLPSLNTYIFWRKNTAASTKFQVQQLSPHLFVEVEKSITVN